MTDVRIQVDGSLIGFLPVTERAEHWFEGNVSSEPWQWLGAMLWVDHRYGRALWRAIADDTDLIVERYS